MKFKYNSIAVVLSSGIGAMSVVRSLGMFGINVTCANATLTGYAMQSKYCRNRLLLPNIELNEEKALEVLEEYGKKQSFPPVLYPSTDQYVLFVSKYRDRLAKYYLFSISPHDVLERLINKLGMFEIAEEHNLPVPLTRLPKSSDDLDAIGEEVGFPCLLKTPYSHSPLKNTENFMTKVSSMDELKSIYPKLSAIDPNLMVQEYISGEDNNIHIFAGYFDLKGEPKLVFTGRKIRQSPINYGAGSICECLENKTLEKIMVQFCQSIGYKGNIDVGLKWDPVQGYCKVLDINPRLGMNHRTFITKDKRLDMARAIYLDLTEGLPQTLTPRLGRKWMIEDSDFRVGFDYIHANRLTYSEWFKSYKGLEEVAFFSLRDCKPWLIRYGKNIKSTFLGIINRIFKKLKT